MSELVYLHLPQVDSTNRYLKQIAKELDPAPIYRLTTDHQTNGYGQFKRPWFSPPGTSLSWSYLFILRKHHPRLAHTAYQAAIALSQGLRERYQLPVQLKWPNDLMLGHQKVGGILCETVDLSCTLDGIVLGVGLNVNVETDMLAQIGQPSSSLKAYTGRDYPLPALLNHLEPYLLKRLTTLGLTPVSNQHDIHSRLPRSLDDL